MKNSCSKKILAKIKDSQNIIITIDGRYDLDAVISATLLYKVIKRELKKKITLTYCGILNNDIEKYFNRKLINENTDPFDIEFSKYDLHVMLDSGNPDKISLNPEYKKQTQIPILNIDHHDINSGYGDFNYVKHEYGSACMVLFELLKKWRFDLTIEEKELVLATILTDTGFFKNIGLSSAKTFRFISSLMEKEGVDYQKVIQPLVNNQPEDNTRLRQIVYKNIVINHKEKYAYSWATKKDVQEFGLNWKNVTVRHADIFKDIETIDFVFFITELDDKNYEVSFRSRDLNFSVLNILKILGGGGYNVAGSAKLGKQKDIEDALETVKAAIKENERN